MKQMFVEYARYNLWANENLIKLFRTVDDALISQEVESSFPSIRQTLLHIWDAESLWLERLNGNSPKVFPSKNFVGLNEAVFDGLLESSLALVNFIENKPALFFREKCTFSLISLNTEMTQKVKDMIMHTMNHSTFHRGQLVTMCRQLGISPIPRTDLIIYSRDIKR
jgi:uncharacterized damage-inducible protein DinB